MDVVGSTGTPPTLTLALMMLGWLTTPHTTSPPWVHLSIVDYLAHHWLFKYLS